MSTLRVNTLQDATGSNQPAMVGAAKAWVNFNGTGTVAIRAAFNVSSITDIETGSYQINFTNAMSDTNYVATGSLIGSTTPWSSTSHVSSNPNGLAPTSSYTYVCTRDAFPSNSGVLRDHDAVCVAVFR